MIWNIYFCTVISENRQIQTDLKKNALSLQEKLPWDGPGVDGRHFFLYSSRLSVGTYIIYVILVFVNAFFDD